MNNINQILNLLNAHLKLEGDVSHIIEMLNNARKGQQFLLYVYDSIVDISRVDYVLSRQTVDNYNNKNARYCYLVEVEDQLKNIGIFHINYQSVKHYVNQLSYDVDYVEAEYHDGTVKQLLVTDVLACLDTHIVDIRPFSDDSIQLDDIQDKTLKLKKFLYDLRIKPSFLNQYKN